MLDVAEQLRSYLNSTAPSIDLDADGRPLTDGVVRRLPDARRSRGPIVWLAAAAVVAVAGVTGLLALRGGSHVETAPADIPPTPAEPTPFFPPPVSTSPMLDWERSEMPGGAHNLLSDGRTFYVFGNARTYRSDDGRSWEEMDLDLGDRPSVWDGRFATATITRSTSGPGVSVAVSDVDGPTRRTTLTPDAVLNAASTSIIVFPDGSVDVTIGPAGIIVTATAIEYDFAPRITDVLGTDPNTVESVRIDDRVQEMLIVELPDRTEEIPIPLTPFDEQPEFRPDAIEEQAMWHSADGSSWAEIDPPRAGLVFSVAATNDGFVAYGEDGSPWHSADGKTWTALTGSPAEPAPIALIPWAGRPVAIDFDRAGLVVVPNEGVETLPVTYFGDGDAGTFIWGFGAGEAGIAYLVSDRPDLDDIVRLEIVYSPDGVTWHQQPLPGDLSDEEIDTWEIWGFEVVVGAEHVAVHLDLSNGPELWIGTPQQP